MAREGRLFLHPCGCTERTDVELLAGVLTVRPGGCDIHGPEPEPTPPTEPELAVDLLAVRCSLATLREALNFGASTLLSQQAIARAVAELEAAERDLTKNDGHGARRG